MNGFDPYSRGYQGAVSTGIEVRFCTSGERGVEDWAHLMIMIIVVYHGRGTPRDPE